MSACGYELTTWLPQFDDRCQIRKPTSKIASMNGRFGDAFGHCLNRWASRAPPAVCQARAISLTHGRAQRNIPAPLLTVAIARR